MTKGANMPENHSHPSSFRDPAGFVFRNDGALFRHVGSSYQHAYDRLMHSGLYDELTRDRLLISHSECDASISPAQGAYKVLKPQQIPFVSYPYEWSFSQLKAAALATLEIQKRAFAHGMTLKDASAYNIQFLSGRPILIDTLSFDRYQEGEPWVAYRQFCQHFLAPLALAAYTDIRLLHYSRIFMDGIPLDLASALLPMRTYLRFPLLAHIHLHAKSQKRYGRTRNAEPMRRTISASGLCAIIDHLESSVRSMEWRQKNTEWSDYYAISNYSAEAFNDKKERVAEFLSACHPKTVWDLGANTGVFSRLASDRGIFTVAFDTDPSAVDNNARGCAERNDANLLPLVLDLTNPSSSIGWAHRERASLSERGPVGAVFALALVHHLAISNNVPLDLIARFFSELGKFLIIEFIPKNDSHVALLLRTRRDIFDSYTEEGFEKAFLRHFSIERKTPIRGSKRTLYLMKNRLQNR